MISMILKSTVGGADARWVLMGALHLTLSISTIIQHDTHKQLSQINSASLKLKNGTA